MPCYIDKKEGFLGILFFPVETTSDSAVVDSHWTVLLAGGSGYLDEHVVLSKEGFCSLVHR